MSLTVAALRAADKRKNLTREQMLALMPDIEFNDGRTKQCFRDECDIDKIMSRFSVTGTMSHLAKYEGTYSDFSDFNFHEQSNMLARGEQIFADLPAEIRREFGQSPADFFRYVNDPVNREMKDRNLPALAKPGDQLPNVAAPDADTTAALAAASEPASVTPTPTPPPTE